VVGAHNSPASAELLRTLGARAVRVDLLDAGAVRKTAPDAIVHEATAFAHLKWTPRHPSWRTGFPAVYAALDVADGPKPHAAPRA